MEKAKIVDCALAMFRLFCDQYKLINFLHMTITTQGCGCCRMTCPPGAGPLLLPAVWRLDGTWEKILKVLRARLRHADGRKKSPSAAIVDTQTVRTASGGEKGYDAGKRTPGRKRHIIGDTMGLLLAVVVHSASLQDRDGVKRVGEPVKGRFPRLKLIWADAAYEAAVGWAKQFGNWVLELVRKPDGRKGFVVQKRRWVVERTFSWLVRTAGWPATTKGGRSRVRR